MPKTKKFTLEVIFGEEASDYACDHGFSAAKRALTKEQFDGLYEKYTFDTEADLNLALQIMEDHDGWNGYYVKEVK